MNEDLETIIREVYSSYDVRYGNAIVDLKQRINKAIEYIEENCVLSDEWKELDFCNFIPTGKITYKSLSSKKIKDLLDILKGSDKK